MVIVELEVTCSLYYQAEYGRRDAHEGLEFRRVLFRSAEIALAAEADAGRIPLRGRVQPGLRRDPPHFALGQLAQREQRRRECFLPEQVTEEIGNASYRERVCQSVSILVGVVLCTQNLTNRIKLLLPTNTANHLE